eukprot:1029436-Rhodomonas_salina.1
MSRPSARAPASALPPEMARFSAEHVMNGRAATVMFRNKPPARVVQNTTNRGEGLFGTSW